MISHRTKKLLVRIFAFFLIMFVGALLFMATEGRHHVLAKDDDKDYQAAYNISTQDYQLLLSSVQNDTYTPGVDTLPWTFGNSLYFVLVLITTIGYGHLCPKTWQGQIFCIFFSLIGIPITALMLKSVGEYIAKAITHLLYAFEKNILRKEPENLERKCFIVTIGLMIFMLVSGAAVTNASEGWTMMEGVYFTFVTLTTIGFGDYVVNDGAYQHKDLTRTVVTQINLIFLLLGLGVVSSVLCSISQLLETGGLCCCKRAEQDIEKKTASGQMEEINVRGVHRFGLDACNPTIGVNFREYISGNEEIKDIELNQTDNKIIMEPNVKSQGHAARKLCTGLTGVIGRTCPVTQLVQTGGCSVGKMK